MKKLIGKTCEALAEAPVIGPLFEPRPKVAVVRLSGIIADGMRRQSISHHKFEKLIEDAFDVYDVKAVALAINSPGGSPGQSALVASHIRHLADEKDIPVYAFVEDVAASGGYWLACAADEIYAQDVSIIGSIGVISASFGLQELAQRHGVERRIHTAGKEKSFLDPFQEEKPADVKRLKTIQKELHTAFIDWVKERRGTKLKGEKKDLFEGQFWTAGPALKKGLIDGAGDLRRFCRDKFGENTKFIEFTPDKRFFSGLLGGCDIKFSQSLPDDLLEALENKTIWNRYGL